MTWHGSSFQTREAAAGKARSPIVDNRVLRTISDDNDAEQRRPRTSSSEDRRSSSARHDGAVPCRCKRLNVRTASLTGFSPELSANAVGGEAERLSRTSMTRTPAWYYCRYDGMPDNKNNIYSPEWPETRKGNCPSKLATYSRQCGVALRQP